MTRITWWKVASIIMAAVCLWSAVLGDWRFLIFVVLFILPLFIPVKLKEPRLGESASVIETIHTKIVGVTYVNPDGTRGQKLLAYVRP